MFRVPLEIQLVKKNNEKNKQICGKIPRTENGGQQRWCLTVMSKIVKLETFVQP